MSRQGFGRIHVVEGNMRSQQYIEVLRRRLQPQADEWFAGQFIYQQDNAPCHTSRVVKQYMEAAGLVVLPWPSNSPDMNPIETLWAVIKEKLRKVSLTSKTDLINEVLNLCVRHNDLSARLQETCQKLVDGMPARVEALVKAKGGHTKY